MTGSSFVASRSLSVGTRSMETSALPTASTHGGAIVARTGPASAVKVTRRRPSVRRLELRDLREARPAERLGDQERDHAAVAGAAAGAEEQDVAAEPLRAGGDQRGRRGRREVEVRAGLDAGGALEAERLQRLEERVGLAAGDGERREARLEAAPRARVAQAQRELQRGLVEDVQDAADVAGLGSAGAPSGPPPAARAQSAGRSAS